MARFGMRNRGATLVAATAPDAVVAGALAEDELGPSGLDASAAMLFLASSAVPNDEAPRRANPSELWF